MSDDISFALAAKSDQLNAMDIQGFEPVLHIRDAKVTKTTEQPVSIYFAGDNNRPWKPSKGMLRILAAAWGTSASQWVGKSAQVFCEPTVRYAGKEVGGIRIRALSHIERDMSFMLSLNRGQRVPYPVSVLQAQTNEYPPAEFDKRFPAMVEAMQDGMSLQQVIAQCEKQGKLSTDQIARLEQAAPVDIDDTEINTDENEEM